MATTDRAITAGDRYYRDGVTGSIGDLATGHWFTSVEEYDTTRRNNGGELVNGTGMDWANLQSQYAALHGGGGSSGGGTGGGSGSGSGSGSGAGAGMGGGGGVVNLPILGPVPVSTLLIAAVVGFFVFKDK